MQKVTIFHNFTQVLPPTQKSAASLAPADHSYLFEVLDTAQHRWNGTSQKSTSEKPSQSCWTQPPPPYPTPGVPADLCPHPTHYFTSWATITYMTHRPLSPAYEIHIESLITSNAKIKSTSESKFISLNPNLDQIHVGEGIHPFLLIVQYPTCCCWKCLLPTSPYHPPTNELVHSFWVLVLFQTGCLNRKEIGSMKHALIGGLYSSPSWTTGD